MNEVPVNCQNYKNKIKQNKRKSTSIFKHVNNEIELELKISKSSTIQYLLHVKIKITVNIIV